ncbi:MAG: 54S ribosomal protein L2 mitochondrial, partial [Paramarteilia canceri]
PTISANSPVTKRRIELFKWQLFKAGTNIYEMDYTITPLSMERHGGRGPDGTQWIHHRGGGCRRDFYWLDKKRIHPEDSDIFKEKVIELIDDQVRSAQIALVAGGLRRRYIMATSEMKIGDIITSSRLILSQIEYKIKEGDCFPLNAFTIGSKICCIERTPFEGHQIASAAGTCCTLVKKYEDSEKKCSMAVVELPSKHSYVINGNCLAVSGQCSKPDFNKTKYSHFAQKNRETDRRSSSGLWHRKDGRFGRKIRPKRVAALMKYSGDDNAMIHDVLNPISPRVN